MIFTVNQLNLATFLRYEFLSSDRHTESMHMSPLAYTLGVLQKPSWDPSYVEYSVSGLMYKPILLFAHS